jgi:hypothetical protein
MRRRERWNCLFWGFPGIAAREAFCFFQCRICPGIFNFGLPDGATTGIVRAKGMNDRTRFFEDVHDVVRLVPAGRVTTYGAIAAYSA